MISKVSKSGLYITLFLVIVTLNSVQAQIFKSKKSPIDDSLHDRISQTINDFREISIPLPAGLYMFGKPDYSVKDYNPIKEFGSGYQWRTNKYKIQLGTHYSKRFDYQLQVRFNFYPSMKLRRK